MSGHVHGAPAAATTPATAPTAAEPPAGTPSWRLLATLAFAGALSGGLIVTVFQATLPAIEAHRASVVESAVREVLGSPARWDTLYLENGALTRTPTGDRKTLERAYYGFDASGQPVGAALTAAAPGFADVITLIFGFDPASGRVLGIKVVGHKETPGLGDRIERPDFTGQFAGVATPIRGVKAETGADDEIVTITGATISSRTIVRLLNDAAARWQPLLQAVPAGAPR